ncbi:MAG: hypothetical protein WDN23_10815 [Edaphobacter sp.]
MIHSAWLLFAIPIVCIFVVAFAQFGDEMFKRKFVIERRTLKENNSGFRRRHTDADQQAGHAQAKDDSILETSGNRR